jgi:Winged helix DNA-binding domain
MGWKDRGWYLGPHRAALFDGAGNAGPTMWVEGRIVGGWAQRPSGEIAVRLLEKVDTETARMIDAEAVPLAAWLGPTRIRWRSREGGQDVSPPARQAEPPTAPMR